MTMTVETLPEIPAMGPLLVRAAATARGRHGDDVPERTLRVEDVTVDRARLAAYQRITGHDVADTLPQTYPWVLASPLQTALMVRPDFPLALPGLVHLENRVTTHRPLDAADPLTLEASAGPLRAHRRGRTVGVRLTAHVAGELVWESDSVYLGRGRGDEDAVRTGGPPDAPEGPARAVWRLPEDLGRRYAAVSGDVNPIHLHPLTARALGFRRHIAHGMWTYARVLSALGRGSLGPSTSRVWFTRPVELPSTVELVARTGSDGSVAAVRPVLDRSRTSAIVVLEG